MALILFIFLSLSTTCFNADVRSTIIPEEQHNSFVSDINMVDSDFDCVDIYKQPGLQHPLLKNHKFQLYPTFARNIVRSRASYGETVDGCPTGKVPIYNMTKRHQVITNSSSELQIDNFRQYSESSPGYHMVTLDTTQNMIFRGAYAMIGAYSLSIQEKQSSLSSIWIQSGPPTEINTIQVGIGVHPSLYGDSRLRLTGLWMVDVDGRIKSGCFNYNCPDFVQVNHDKGNALGVTLGPTSPIGSPNKTVFHIKIKQDPSTGHWWLIIDPESVYVGYWPKELFTHLSNGASLIRFGGQTFSSPNQDSPPMGSGRLPKEKFLNSGFMGRLEIIDSEYNEKDVKYDDMKKYNDANLDCYDLGYNGYAGPVFRQAFLYGGPGGQNCDI